MDQTSSATALSGTPPLLGGLLSQLDTSSAQDGLFSNLLSDSDNLASVFAAQPVSASAATTPNTLSSLTGANGSSSSFGLLQTLDGFSKTLNQALSVLHQQSNATTANTKAASAKASKQTSSASSDHTATASTQTATQSNAKGYSSTGSQSDSGWRANQSVKGASTSTTTTASATDTNQDTDTTDAASTSTVTDPQTLASIIAQLLAMTQALIKNLEQTPNGTGNSDKTQTAADTTVGQTAESSTSDSIANLVAALTAVVAALPQKGSATASVTASASSSSAGTTETTPVDLLSQLVSDMQKTLQKLAPLVQATSSSVTVDAGAVVKTPLADMLSLVSPKSLTFIPASQAGVAADTNNVPAVAEQKTVTVKAATKNIVAPLAVSASTTAASSTAQTAVADTQTPIVAATNKEKAKSSTSSTQSQILAVQSSLATEAATQDTASQTVANTAAAWVAAAAKSGDTGTDTNGDFSSDNDNTPSFTLAKTADSNTASAGLAQAAGTYNFASTLSAIRAANGGTTGLPTVADQVILQMSRSIKTGNDQMSLQLQPGDLGKITVKLNFSTDGKVQGTVTADNPQTLDMLQKDSRSLERALQDAGLRADPGSLQFNLGGQGNGNNAGQANNNGTNNANGTNEDGTISATDNAGLADLGAAETYYVTPNGVNIRV